METRPSPDTPVAPGASYRPIRVIGLLLILEAAALVVLGLYELSRIPWRRLLARGEVPAPETVEPATLEPAAVVLFAPPAVLTLVAALSFLLLRRRGWLLAAISQGLTLAVSLSLYTELQPVYVYPVMAYAILLVLYLNSHDVRVVFHAGSPRDPTPRGTAGTPGGGA